MQPSTIKGTWLDDPAHFRRPSRRWFMQVGALGGIGLTLDSLFRVQTARADQKFYESKEGPAKSAIQLWP